MGQGESVAQRAIDQTQRFPRSSAMEFRRGHEKLLAELQTDLARARSDSDRMILERQIKRQTEIVNAARFAITQEAAQMHCEDGWLGQDEITTIVSALNNKFTNALVMFLSNKPQAEVNKVVYEILGRWAKNPYFEPHTICLYMIINYRDKSNTRQAHAIAAILNQNPNGIRIELGDPNGFAWLVPDFKNPNDLIPIRGVKHFLATSWKAFNGACWKSDWDLAWFFVVELERVVRALHVPEQIIQIWIQVNQHQPRGVCSTVALMYIEQRMSGQSPDDATAHVMNPENIVRAALWLKGNPGQAIFKSQKRNRRRRRISIRKHLTRF